MSCDDYGIISGCDLNCPILNSGHCKVFLEVYYDFKLEKNYDNQELIELYKIYYPNTNFLKNKVAKIKKLIL